MTWLRKGSDDLKNGLVLGAIIGILIASSSISWIQSIVTSVTNLIPAEYQFEYAKYVVWGLLGLLAGYIIDRV